jgi:hypothetical protein
MKQTLLGYSSNLSILTKIFSESVIKYRTERLQKWLFSEPTHPVRRRNIWMVPKRTQTSSEAAEIEDEWKYRSSANMCMWMISRAIQILAVCTCAFSYIIALVFHIMTAIIIIWHIIKATEAVDLKNVFLLVSITGSK